MCCDNVSYHRTHNPVYGKDSIYEIVEKTGYFCFQFPTIWLLRSCIRYPPVSIFTIQNYLMSVPTSVSASMSSFSNFVLSIFGWTGVCVQTEYFVYQSLYRQYLDVIQIEIRQTIFEEISDRRAAFFLKSRQNPDS